eukprot:5544581-Amphidinium_carterae.1
MEMWTTVDPPLNMKFFPCPCLTGGAGHCTTSAAATSMTSPGCVSSHCFDCDLVRHEYDMKAH